MYAGYAFLPREGNDPKLSISVEKQQQQKTTKSQPVPWVQVSGRLRPRGPRVLPVHGPPRSLGSPRPSFPGLLAACATPRMPPPARAPEDSAAWLGLPPGPWMRDEDVCSWPRGAPGRGQQEDGLGGGPSAPEPGTWC